MNIILWIVLGALAGWIAEMIMNTSHGLLENIILGIVGAFIGGFLMNLLGYAGVSGFNFYSIVVAVLGAILVIFIGRQLHR